MQSTALGRELLARVSDYLASFPFDLKILQEAIAEPDLDRGARELAAGVLVNALLPQEGQGPERFVDDVLMLRIVFSHIAKHGGEEAAAFCGRFDEVYSRLDEDLQIFADSLGAELWEWLCARPAGVVRLSLKGKRVSQYVEDDSTWDALYEAGIAFQTNYDVSEQQVRNKLRRPEQIVEILSRRHAEESKKRP